MLSVKDIDVIVMESEINVLLAQYDLCEKQLMMLEYGVDPIDGRFIFCEDGEEKGDVKTNTVEKKKNILVRMWEFIKGLFKKIIAFFKKKIDYSKLKKAMQKNPDMMVPSVLGNKEYFDQIFKSLEELIDDFAQMNRYYSDFDITKIKTVSDANRWFRDTSKHNHFPWKLILMSLNEQRYFVSNISLNDLIPALVGIENLKTRLVTEIETYIKHYDRIMSDYMHTDDVVNEHSEYIQSILYETKSYAVKTLNDINVLDEILEADYDIYMKYINDPKIKNR